VLRGRKFTATLRRRNAGGVCSQGLSKYSEVCTILISRMFPITAFSGGFEKGTTVV
jgi:hypothetical protein